MNKDLFLSPSLVTFEDFSDLLTAVDEYIDAHKKAIAKYEDRLGVMLRGANGGDSKQGMMRFDQDQTNGAVDDSQEGLQRKRKRPSSSDGSEEGWLVLESEETSLKIASGSLNSTTAKQTEALFKIIESLKARLVSLERVRKLIADLPSQGFKPDQKIVVMFRDGLPRQIIPSYEVAKAQAKFKYSEQFDIQVLT